MTDHEVIRCVDDGANFYLRFFGDAAHMECHDNDRYSYIVPKPGEHGIRFAFGVNLEKLPKGECLAKISELKALKMPVWWGLQTSDGLYRLIHGKDREKPTAEPADGDELYMAILPGEYPGKHRYTPANLTVKRVETPAAFEEWAAAVNSIMFGGYADIHPANHYHWCRKGLINCFTGYCDGVAVSFAAALDNDRICSLEFVATAPDYRRRGFAGAICSEAMRVSFENGAKIITLRAFQPGTRQLYTSLGYKTYNHVL